jgi:copper(I)-binding protein
MKSVSLCAVTFLIVLACSSEQPPLLAEDLKIVRPVPGMSMGAGYLTLENNSEKPISITRVHSPELVSVEMHESVLEDGVSRMYKLQEVVILPGQSVRFEPGGKHLMLRYRATIPARMTLQFYAGETLMLSLGATIHD